MYGKFTQTGLIPIDEPATEAIAIAEPADPAQVEPLVEDVAEAVPEALPEADVLDVPAQESPAPEPDASPTAAQVADRMIAATFSLLRAEPDGSIVIAGSGTPGSELEILADGEPIGRVQVEASGDWVFVPDVPLPPGGVEITLAEVGRNGVAPDSFVVVIDPDRSRQPLVVASRPGEASQVLQGLDRPADIVVAEMPEPALALPAAEDAPSVQTGETNASDSVSEAEAAPVQDDPSNATPIQPEVASVDTDATADSAIVPEPDAAAASEPIDEPLTPTVPVEEQTAELAPAVTDAEPPVAAAPTEIREEQTAETATAATDEDQAVDIELAVSEAGEQEPEVAADPVEESVLTPSAPSALEDVAATSAPATMEVEQDVAPPAETGVELATDASSVEVHDSQAEADDAGSSEFTPLADVDDQQVSVSEGVEPAAPALAEDMAAAAPDPSLGPQEGGPAVPDPATDEGTEVEIAAITSDQPAVEPTPVEVSVAPARPAIGTVPPTIDAIEIDGERNFFAGAGPDGVTMRLYVDDQFVADAVVDGGRWLVETDGVLTSSQHTVRVDMLVPGTAEVAARAGVNFVIDLPEPVGASIAVADASQPDASGETQPDTSSPEASTSADEGETGEAGNDDELVVAALDQPETEVPAAEPVVGSAKDEPAASQSNTAPLPSSDVDEVTPTAVPSNEPETVVLASEGKASEPSEPASADEPTSPSETVPEEAEPAAPADAGAPEPVNAQPANQAAEQDLATSPPEAEVSGAQEATEVLPVEPQQLDLEPVAAGPAAPEIVSEPVVADPGAVDTAPTVPHEGEGSSPDLQDTDRRPAEVAEPLQTVEAQAVAEAEDPRTTEPGAGDSALEQNQTSSADPSTPTSQPAVGQEGSTPIPAVNVDIGDAAPAPPEQAATEAPSADPAVAAPELVPEQVAAPLDPSLPTLVAMPVGDPEALRFASGRAIIRRGDNLWTIARRVYGEGIRYTTIYEANVGQIRDPHRIYPGQVFDLPESQP